LLFVGCCFPLEFSNSRTLGYLHRVGPRLGAWVVFIAGVMCTAFCPVVPGWYSAQWRVRTDPRTAETAETTQYLCRVFVLYVHRRSHNHSISVMSAMSDVRIVMSACAEISGAMFRLCFSVCAVFHCFSDVSYIASVKGGRTYKLSRASSVVIARA